MTLHVNLKQTRASGISCGFLPPTVKCVSPNHHQKVGNEVSIHAPSTFAPRILCTGSESSKTTNPKLGSFPPTPLVLIRSSTTVPYAVRKKVCNYSSPLKKKPLIFHVVENSLTKSCFFWGNLLMKKSLSSLSSMSCGRLPTKSWWLSGYRTIRLLSISPGSTSRPPAGQNNGQISSHA